MELLYSQMSDRVIDNKEKIAQFITNAQNRSYPNLLKMVTEELLPLRMELVDIYGKSLRLTSEERMPLLQNWGFETSNKCVELGTTLESMLKEVPEYRLYIGQELLDLAKELSLNIEEYHSVISRLDEIMNEVVYYFCVPFVDYQSNELEKSQKKIFEMSAPVIQVHKGIGVLPLIGTVDEHRATLIMEKSLEQSSIYQLDHFVVDLSGVPVMDTFAAQNIFQIIQALSLLGVNVIISGVSPSIAQTVVQLGIEFGGIPTYSSLHMALESIHR